MRILLKRAPAVKGNNGEAQIKATSKNLKSKEVAVINTPKKPTLIGNSSMSNLGTTKPLSISANFDKVPKPIKEPNVAATKEFHVLVRSNNCDNVVEKK